MAHQTNNTSQASGTSQMDTTSQADVDKDLRWCLSYVSVMDRQRLTQERQQRRDQRRQQGAQCQAVVKRRAQEEKEGRRGVFKADGLRLLVGELNKSMAQNDTERVKARRRAEIERDAATSRVIVIDHLARTPRR